MTTILADTRLGVMASDSRHDDEATRGTMRKVWRVRGGLIGLAGSLDKFAPFLLWIKGGMEQPPPKLGSFAALWLQPHGLLHFADSPLPIVVQGRCWAIGTGATAALAAHESLGFQDPRRAVVLASKYDARSGPPVRLYRL